MELRGLTLVDIAIVAVVVGVVFATVMVIYPYFADRARRLFPSNRSARNLNLGAGTVLIGTRVIIAARKPSGWTLLGKGPRILASKAVYFSMIDEYSSSEMISWPGI